MAILKIRDENGNMVEVPALVGSSAYQIALKNGFEGTEEEWLESLHGKQGPSGVWTSSDTPPEGYDVWIDPNGDIGLNNETIPSYWKGSLIRKSRKINNEMVIAGRDKSSFLFYSDVYFDNNSKKSPLLLNYLHQHTMINKTFFGGNMGTDFDCICEWRSMIKNLPNHHSAIRLYDKAYYGLCLAPEETPDIVIDDSSLDYYIDNHSEKTRYIFLNELQESFIEQTLLSTPENWHIVVISYKWYEVTDLGFYFTPVPVVGLYDNMSYIISTFLDPYNARSDKYANCNAKIEFCIGGYVRQDYVGKTPGGIPIILVETDSMETYSDLECNLNTASESSVNGIIANYTTNTIHVIRIGRGTSFTVDLITGTATFPTERDNLFIAEEVSDNYRLNDAGALEFSNGDLTTGFISVEPNKEYKLRVALETFAEALTVDRVSEYSEESENAHKIQYKCMETDQFSYKGDSGNVFVFTFTTSNETHAIRVNVPNCSEKDLIITLNVPLDNEYDNSNHDDITPVD